MNKKLGLLLIPFIPLTAIGIVEVASHIMPPANEPVAVHHVRPIVETPVAPVVKYTEPHFAPAPVAPPTAPEAVVAA